MNKYFLSISIAWLFTLPQMAAADNWDFRLNPYIWFTDQQGDVATIPGAPTVPIDISSREAFDNTEAGFMVFLDAKRGKHGVFADVIYTDFQSNYEFESRVNLTLQSVSKTSIFSLAYQYEFYRKDDAIIDLMLGARYWNIDTELNFGGGLGILADQKINHNESWVDPAVGVKGVKWLGGSGFYIEGGAGLGGFGAGSDLFYEFNGGIGYQWNSAIGTTIGYRLFDVDYQDSGFTYDIQQQGWQLGLRWSF